MRTIPKQLLLTLAVLLTGFQSSLWSQCIPLNTDLGNDTVICQGDELTLDAGLADSYIWQDGSTNRYITVSEPGIYWVNTSNECSDDRDSITINMVVPPDFNLKIPDKNYFCKGEKVEINVDGLGSLTDFYLEWSVGDNNTPYVIVDSTTDVSLSVKDLHGCKRSKNIKVDFQFPYKKEKVLLATYNKEYDRNMVIWSKTPGKRTEKFSIFSGQTADNLLEEVSFNATNMLIDEANNPHEKSAFYTLNLTDSCQNSTLPGIETGARTMLLQTGTNEFGENVLYWNKYLGFDYDYFYVYRGTSADKMEIIDSISSRSPKDTLTYIDQRGVKDQLYYYQVAVKTPEPVYYDIEDNKKGKGGPYAHSLSNLEDNKLKSTIAGYINPRIRIFPNPFTEEAHLTYTVRRNSHVRIELINLSGAHIATLKEGMQSAGTYEVTIDADRYGMKSGIWFVRIGIEEAGLFTFKLIQN